MNFPETSDEILGSREDRVIAAILLCFSSLFFLVYALEAPINEFVAGFIRMRSEYTVNEQLSKFYIFLVIVLSIHSYQIFTDRVKIKLSVCFLFLGIAMYLGESNMITEQAQPFFGALVLPYIYWHLFRSRSYFVLTLLTAGLLAITMGYLIDSASEHRFMTKLLVDMELADRLPKGREELFELLGVALICVAVIVFSLDFLKIFVRKNMVGTVFILACSAMITVGNGFIHYQYKPSQELMMFAASLSISGFFGFVLLHRSINRKNKELALINKECFYLFLYLFFILLPAVFGKISDKMSLLVWMPFLVAGGYYMYFTNHAVIIQRHHE
jgi:hypothetical protein